MTIRQWAQTYLTDRGMWPQDAVTIIERMDADPALQSMNGRWDEDTSGYPPALLSALSFNLDLQAVIWIEANCPEAWYRSLFDPGQETTSERA
jgi:hypothetical protein